MFSLGKTLSGTGLRATPFPFMTTCAGSSLGAGVGVDGVDTAAACLLVRTPDIVLLSSDGEREEVSRVEAA
jgi:hypothetical protein